MSVAHFTTFWIALLLGIVLLWLCSEGGIPESYSVLVFPTERFPVMASLIAHPLVPVDTTEDTLRIGLTKAGGSSPDAESVHTS